MKILMAEYQPWQHRIEDGEHKYARFFLEDGHQVFWLANFMNVNRLIRKREDDFAYEKLWRTGVEKPFPGLTTFTPFAWLPYVKGSIFESKWIGTNFMRFTQPSLKRTLKAYGFTDIDLLWIGNQRLYSVTSLVNYKTMAYRMKDDVEQYGSEPRTIAQIEQSICAKADIVFYTANRLKIKAERNAKRTYFLPNGVDFDYFREPQLELPADLEKISAPRVIYVGQISHWFDFDSILAAAKSLNSCSFVIIGPTSLDASGENKLNQLRELPNIHVLGSRPFSQIRSYLRYSDVGLIPFLRTSLTHAISPIKLFEYCAAGLPVVSTRLDETERLQSPALLYETTETFIANIQSALQQRDALGKQGIEFGKNNTWRQRFNEIRQQIEQLSNKNL